MIPSLDPVDSVPGYGCDPVVGRLPFGETALALSLPRLLVTACIFFALALSLAPIAYAQQAKRSNVIPFRQFIDPTRSGRARRPQENNPGSPVGQVPDGQRPWESRDQPLEAKTLENAQIIARVGPEVIFAGEVLAGVDRIMEENRIQIPPRKWDEIRRRLMKQMLKPLLQQKLIVVDALGVIPEEALPEIEKQVDKQFYSEHIKELMRRAEVTNLAALETKLNESHSSIEQQKRIFFERSLASQWVQQQVADNQPITHQEMLEHYTSHLKDYEQPERCRWEQLSVHFEKYSSPEEAWRAIASMGNTVVHEEGTFEQVAREHSQGLTAAQGGIRNWTTRGSLVSAPLDEAIFTLPLGQLSPIIKDNTGYHIIRVTERNDAHRTPFRDAQVEIANAIAEQRREEKMNEYLESLQQKIFVWTLFDEDPAAGTKKVAMVDDAASQK